MSEQAKRIGRIVWRFVKFMFSPLVVGVAAFTIGHDTGYRRGSVAMKDAIFGVLEKMADLPEPATTPARNTSQIGEG